MSGGKLVSTFLKCNPKSIKKRIIVKANRRGRRRSRRTKLPEAPEEASQPEDHRRKKRCVVVYTFGYVRVVLYRLNGQQQPLSRFKKYKFGGDLRS